MEWDLSVTIGGVDRSNWVTGTLTIDAEESTSRTAKITFRPPTGVIDINNWVGATAVIDFIELPASTTRIFTGRVSEPIYDPETKLLECRCSDDLQGHFNAKTEAQILAAIPGGLYDDAVFGKRSSGWQQAEDVLSTVAKSYDLDRTGTPIVTAWAAKGVADYSYTASTARDVRLDLVRLRDIVNKVIITAEYRFIRLHHREHDFLWQWTGLCDYLNQSYELPTRDMVYSASEGLEWTNKRGQICFTTLPDSGTYCGGINFTVTDEIQDLLCTSASWRAVRRWVQDVTEVYTLTVRESGSIAQYGERILEDSAGVETDYDAVGWESSFGTEDPGFLGGSLDPYDEDGCGSGTLEAAPEDSWVWEDKSDDAERTNMIETLLQVASTEILSSHRQNYVQFQIAINPFLERSHTVEITAADVTAKGKVFQYRHDISIDDGSALTTVKIAVSKCPAGGSTDALTAPAQPVTDGYVAPNAYTEFSTHIGNDDTVDPYDPDWDGFTGNYSVAVGSPADNQIYPRRFRAVGADIEDTARDEITGPVAQTYDVDAPNETLTVTV